MGLRGFQTPTIRERLTVRTPPSTPTFKKRVDNSELHYLERQGRQCPVEACEDDKLFLPLLDWDSPAKIHPTINSDTSFLSTMIRDVQVIVLSRQREQQNVLGTINFARWGKIMELMEQASSSRNKRSKPRRTSPPRSSPSPPFSCLLDP